MSLYLNTALSIVLVCVGNVGFGDELLSSASNAHHTLNSILDDLEDLSITILRKHSSA